MGALTSATEQHSAFSALCSSRGVIRLKSGPSWQSTETMANLTLLQHARETSGRDRTEAEYRALYAAAGFSLARTAPAGDELHIIEGMPVHMMSAGDTACSSKIFTYSECTRIRYPDRLFGRSFMSCATLPPQRCPSFSLLRS